MNRSAAQDSHWLISHNRAGLVSLLTLGILLASGWFASQWYAALLLTEQRAYVTTELTRYQNVLITAINRRQVFFDSLRTAAQTDLKVLLNAHPSNLAMALSDDTGQVLYGSPDAFQAEPITARIEWPEGAWNIAAVPIGGWQASVHDSLRIFQVAGIFIIGLLTGIVYLTTQRQAQLTQAVRQRTHELSLLNLNLQRDIAARVQAEQALRAANQKLNALIQAAPIAIVELDTAQRVQRWNPAAERIFGWHTAEVLGHKLPIVSPDASHALHTAPQSFAALELRLRRKDGSTVSVSQSAAALRDAQNRVVGTLMTYVDMTERRLAEEALRRSQAQLLEKEQRRRVAEGLREILAVLNSKRPLPEILQHIVQQACHLLHSDAGALYRLDTTELCLRTQAAHGLPADYLAQPPIPNGVGAIGRAVSERQPIAVTDAYDAAGAASSETYLSHFRAWFAVPLIIQRETYGSLGFYYAEAREFSEEELSLAMSLSDQATLAIENARLHEQAQQLAMLEERQRIARELHDSVSQALYGISLGAHTARAHLERNPRKVAESLDYMLSLADMGLTEMRALIFELRPESLAKEGLVAALNKQVAVLRARHQLTVQTRLCQEPQASLQTKEAFYRVAQESFHNVVKHARAHRVEVQLTQTDGVLTLEVRDNGRGFDAQREFPGHLGLQSMRERIADIGGALSIESAHGQGACIRATVPLT